MFIVSTLLINPNYSENTLILSVALNHPAVDMVYPASSSSHYIWQTISPLLDRNADVRFEMSPKLYSTFIWYLALIASLQNNASFHLQKKYQNFGSDLFDTTFNCNPEIERIMHFLSFKFISNQ